MIAYSDQVLPFQVLRGSLGALAVLDLRWIKLGAAAIHYVNCWQEVLQSDRLGMVQDRISDNVIYIYCNKYLEALYRCVYVYTLHVRIITGVVDLYGVGLPCVGGSVQVGPDLMIVCLSVQEGLLCRSPDRGAHRPH